MQKDINIIFFGAPGAGKGTQAKKISNELKLPHLDTGNLIREAIKNKTELGIKAKEFVESGNLVPDDLVINLIKEKLTALKNGSFEGFILDGFPRTIGQANALDKLMGEINLSLSCVVNVQAPENAAPGGHYVAVYFEPTSVTQEGSSNVSVRIVSLVNIKVPGTIKEETMISFFKAPQFAEQSPIEVDFAISNTGDYHITPRGKLVLTNMFGATVDQMSLPSHNIFPGSTRNYKLSLGKGFLLGQMKIHLTAQYGERLRSLDKTQNVFVFPWRLFLILCLGLIILYYMVRSVMGSRTSYPRENSSRGQSLTDLRTLREKVRKRND